MRRLFPLCWAVALTSAHGWAADLAPQRQPQLGVGSSPVVAGGRASFAKDAFVFADFDGDGEEELLTTTETVEHPRHISLTVLRWSPTAGGRVEWKSRPLSYVMTQMLVGNIDDDPLPEILVFGEIPGRPPKLRVIQWDDGRVVETELALAGKLGLLADIDDDGRDELVLVRVRVHKFDAIFEPSNLVAYAYRDGRFAATHKRELAVGVQALASVDVNGDGRSEVVASETSFGNEVSGRLSVYRFEPGGAVPVAFRRNGALESIVDFLGAFHGGGGVYLLAETWSGWQSVFRVWEEAGTLRVAPVGADRPSLPVFEAARLATAAYSAERGMFFQFAEGDQTRLVPVGSAH